MSAMRDEDAAAFARSVLGWFAGELDRAVFEAQVVAAAAATSPAAAARADLQDVQRAVLEIERAFAGVVDEAADGETLAGRFCVQLVWGFCALFEWHRLEVEGERDQ
jgi:hypothetical protein